MVTLPDGEKSLSDTFTSFDRTYKRDRPTEGHHMMA